MYCKWGRTKPPPGSLLDRGHLLAQGMLRCLLLAEGYGQAQESCFQESLQSGTTFSPWSGSPVGTGGFFPAAAASCRFVASNRALPSSVGAVALRFTTHANWSGGAYATLFSHNSTGNDQNIIAILRLTATESQANQLSFMLSNSASAYWGGAFNSLRSEPLVDSTTYSVVMTWDQNFFGCYLNGRFQSSLPGPARTPSAFSNWSIGNATHALTTRMARANINYLYMWNRRLSQREISWLHEEPFAMIRSPRSISYFVPAQAFNPGWVQPGVVIGGGCI